MSYLSSVRSKVNKEQVHSMAEEDISIALRPLSLMEAFLGRKRFRDLNSGPESNGRVIRDEPCIILTVSSPGGLGISYKRGSQAMVGVIRHTGPAHPKYSTTESRIRSFGDWPPALKQRPAQLAEAGFWYVGKSCEICLG